MEDVATSWTIGEVARRAGVSVRTLRHYDAIGLLTPAGRADNGYRHYETRDLERLQRILAYRALGLGLTSIAAILTTGDDRRQLAEQADALARRIDHLRAVHATILTTLEARTMGIELTPDDLLAVFGEEDPTIHARETERRWGDTDAWATAQRRTRRYGTDDWMRAKEEADAIEADLAKALTAGLPADGERARSLAEAHRLHIDRWYYPCSHAMQRNLAAMYLADERFRDHYDRRAPGLAAFLTQAIEANATAAGDGTDAGAF